MRRGIPRSLADLDTRRTVRAIADRDGDLGIEFPARDAVGDGFEVGAAAGNQNAEARFQSILHAGLASPLLNDFANDPGFLNGSCGSICPARRPVYFGESRNHADSQIESTAPIGERYVTDGAQHLEAAAEPAMTRFVWQRRVSCLKHARQVIDDAPACDVRCRGRGMPIA